MGFPMAKNLLKSGVKLKVFNRTVKKADPLKNFGAEISSSIGEVVKNCDFIITMLTDDVAVDMVMSNFDFLENLKIGSTLIDMSSVKPSTAIKYGKIFKSKNINYLDAPVSGGTIGAEEGSLAIMVGGEQTIFDKSTDILKIMGKPELVGPIGSGQVSKLANQIIVGITIGAVAEAITLCEKTGTDPIKLIKALSGGWAGYYDCNKLDNNAVVGKHPKYENVYLASGFTGRGLMQAPGIGRALTELITTGSYQTIDISDFAVERVLDSKARPEPYVL